MSSSTPIINVEKVGKQYRLGSRRARYATVREVLASAVRAPFRRFSGFRQADETFWALKDVSFEISAGQAVGVIGRNGAGKSTLLKILSRITRPTTGRVELYGRVGSLLEVGTGFHPELTGRENVYLSGAILGMGRAEIARKFDEIVDFAEVERFIETPVKYYSSGMYLRLAFSVAAHLEPDVLIVDEVLAVGDMAFQRKCISKMNDVGGHGRTVIFVSHSMPAVSRLCQRVLLLSDGTLIKDGPSEEVIKAYVSSGMSTLAEREWPGSNAPGDDVVKLRRVRTSSENGATLEVADIRRAVGIEMVYDVLEPGVVMMPNYHLYNEEGVCLFVVHDLDPDWRFRPRPVGRFISTVWIPGNFLAEGSIFVTAALSTYFPLTVHFIERDTVVFRVVDSLEGDSARGDYAGQMPGVIRPILPWTTRMEAAPAEAGLDKMLLEPAPDGSA
jgi:lipopolysaccharide transport system ATP-binding protein